MFCCRDVGGSIGSSTNNDGKVDQDQVFDSVVGDNNGNDVLQTENVTTTIMEKGVETTREARYYT